MFGVIGLGRMGSGIAGSLLRQQFDLIVFDTDPSRVSGLVSSGAAGAGSVADMCDRCDTIVLSLPNSPTTVGVMETDLLPSVRKGTVIIDTGTTVVRETIRMRDRFRERGAELVDAPVSGGSGGAAKGALFVFVGGDRAAVDARWQVLQAFGGAKVTYCGGSGCGQITKAVNQLAMGLVDAAFIEAVAFGENAGVDAATLKEAVGGDSGFRKHFRQIAQRIAEGDGDGNDVKYAEFPYFLDEVRRAEFESPMLEALHSFMRRFPETRRDNMERPYPPLWSALTGGGSPKTLS